MNRALWVGQILLGLAFIGAGGPKLLTPTADLAVQFEGFPAGFGRLIGTLEVAGAVGVIAPAATGLLPVLTPAAAGGLAVIMVGAAFTHLFRAEYVQILPPLLLFALALFVAYGRVRLHAVAPSSR